MTLRQTTCQAVEIRCIVVKVKLYRNVPNPNTSNSGTTSIRSLNHHRQYLPSTLVITSGQLPTTTKQRQSQILQIQYLP